MTSAVLNSRGHRVLIGILIVASLVPIWTVEYFPSQNGPWSLLMAKMLRDYSNPAFNYSFYYEPSWHAIPHLLHTMVVYALSAAMPVVVAHKVAISVFVALFPLSVFVLLEALDSRRTVLGYASFLFVYNVPLLRGYHDYSIGVPLVLLTFAYWWKRRHALSGRARLVIMGMTVLVYFSHIFNVAVLGLSIVLTTAWEQRSVRAVFRAAMLFVIPALLTLEYAWFTVTHAEWVDHSERVFLTPPAAVEAFFSRFFYTVSYPAYLVLTGVLIVWSYLVGLGLLHTWRRWKSGEVSGSVAFALPLVLAALTTLYFIAPYKFLNWHYANVRFIPYVLVFALACAAHLPYRPGRLFAGSMAGAALVSYALLTQGFIRANDMIQEYVSGADVVEMNSTILPVSFSGEQVGEISPVAHAIDYYQVYRGGANGWGMAQFNTLTPLVYRTYPVRDQFPSLRNTPVDAVVRAYDYVLLWDDPGAATARLTGLGFEVAHERGRLRILRNRHRLSKNTATATVPGEGSS
jgi:hypothetical protein